MPQLRISIAHGQMSATELNQSMRGFIDKKTDLLLCTTIIESGIDNHNVNTIFINDADSMGLAQVHQLRGRVGRGSRKAFCYVVTRPEQLLSSDGKLRVRAIESMSDLGAGFSLAAHDLEIRGAGEILGARQSGDIQQIGFNYYNELLSKAIEAIKNNHLNSIDLSFDQNIEINLSIPALIPEDYMPDINQRISFYRKITDSNDFNRVKIELIDRYGPIPIEIENFYLINRIKKLLKQALAVKINGNAQRFKITLSENHLFNIDKILRDTKDESLAYEISIGKDNSLTFKSLMDFNFTKDILDTIERYV
jgi:transcription-repair coupling factor (superfamily II helicase)